MKTIGKGELLKSAKNYAQNDSMYIFNKANMNYFCDQAIDIGINRERETIIRLCELRAQQMRDGYRYAAWDKIEYDHRPAMAIVLQALAEEIRLRNFDPETLRELREGEIDVEVTL